MISRKNDPSIYVDAQGQEVTAHGTSDFPLDCYEIQLGSGFIEWHWHDDWEIILVRNGMVYVCTASGKWTVSAGQAMFFGPECVHEITGGSPDSMFHSAVFHPRFLASQGSLIWQKYVQPLQKVGCVPLFPEIPWQEECILLFKECLLAFDNTPSFYEIQTREALTKLASLLSTRLDFQQYALSVNEVRNNQRIHTMLQFIHAHYGEEIHVSDIAACAMLSRSECLHCFHNTIHTTPNQYLKDYRLQAAAQMLVSTNKKLGDIGAACGMPDAAYFTKLFREAMGCTPGEYRKGQQAKEID